MLVTSSLVFSETFLIWNIPPHWDHISWVFVWKILSPLHAMNFTLQQHWLASHVPHLLYCSHFPAFAYAEPSAWNASSSSSSVYLLFTILQYLLQEGFPNLAPPQTGLGSSPSRIHNALCLLLSLNLAFYGSPTQLWDPQGQMIMDLKKQNKLFYIVTGILWALSKILVKS